MKAYIGTKQVKLHPMTRLEYNRFRGWELPSDENGSDEGYLVEYLDGDKPNTDEYDDFVSWSPKEQADNAYRSIDEMTFGDALVLLKQGKPVSRSVWGGKALYMVNGDSISAEVQGLTERLFDPTYGDVIYLRTIDNQLTPWTPYHFDILANDWCELSE